jgi:hypothetical protein
LGEGLTSSDDVEARLEEIEEEIKGRLFILRTADQDGWGVAKHLQEEEGFFTDEKYKRKAKEAKKLAQLDKAAKPSSGYVKAGNGKGAASNSRYQPYAAPAASTTVAKTVQCYRCGGVGHYASQCSAPQPGTANNGQQTVAWKQVQRQCYACGQMGHIANQCPGSKKGTQGP